MAWRVQISLSQFEYGPLSIFLDLAYRIHHLKALDIFPFNPSPEGQTVLQVLQT
jgi:hypothetical protein